MRGQTRRRWQQRANAVGTASKQKVPPIPSPIVVTPRYARFLDEQRERLKAEALARLGQSAGSAAADS